MLACAAGYQHTESANNDSLNATRYSLLAITLSLQVVNKPGFQTTIPITYYLLPITYYLIPTLFIYFDKFARYVAYAFS